MSTEIIITDRATPALGALTDRMQPQRLAAAIGPACAREVQLHLAKRPPNKKGWPTTHFYEQASDSTRWEPVEGGAMISVHKQGIRQRYRGGPIAPVNAKALTIPISPLSYGRTAADFPGLFLLKTPKGAYLVLKQTNSAFKGALKASLTFLFKLSGGVDQAADPDVMPSRDRMVDVAKRAIQMAIRKPLGGANGQ